MKKRRIQFFTLMFVPDGNGRTFYIKVNKNLVMALSFFVLVFFAGITFLVVKTAEIGIKMQLAFYLKNENERLREENEKLYSVVKKIDSMERTGDYLRRLADIINVKVPLAQSAGVAGTSDIVRADSLDADAEDQRMRAAALEKLSSSGAEQDPTLFASSIPTTMPVNGWVTRMYDQTTVTEHRGLDIAAPTGELIRATAPGIISEVFEDPDLGVVVVVKHRFGYETRFGHCRESIVSVGEIVDRGEAIAFVGNTGRSTAPHVHYEVLKNGIPEDPASYIMSMQASKRN